MRGYRHLSQILTLEGALKKDGRRLLPDDLSVIQDGAIVFDDQAILWVGPSSHIPAQFSAASFTDLPGHVLTPGLVDSHTHLLFGGNRAGEYVRRLNGEDYQAIARGGGGILYTVAETLKLSEAQLVELGRERINRIAGYGVTTLEMKSGYALSLEGELRLLRAAHTLKRVFAGRVEIVSTFLGAHAVPSAFATSQDFLRSVVLPTLQQAAREGIVDLVDIFCEEGYFSLQDGRELFREAHRLGLGLKVHADEFTDGGGAELAVAFGALSADHLLRTSDAGIRSLAKSDTVATLLPCTAFFLGKPLARARDFLDAGCRVAIASDFNPGSSHVDNVLLVASIAAAPLGLNVAELWAAIGLNAAAALGKRDRGALVPGMRPQFALFEVSDAAEISYSWGRNFSRGLP